MQRKLVLLLTLGALGVVGVSTAQDAPKFDTGKAIAGERSFRTYCTSCHGKLAKGDGPLAQDLVVKPANLTVLSENYGGEFPYMEVYKTIDHGKKVRGHGTVDMPAWGSAFLTTDTKEEAVDRIHDLCQYIWSLQPKK